MTANVPLVPVRSGDAMIVTMEWRTGFGVDIEANNLVCYVVEGDDDKEHIVQFEGTIISLPFIKIHIGDYWELENFVDKGKQ